MNIVRRSVDDPRAFGEVYERHARRILVFLTRRTCDPETALDLTAETFARAFVSRRRFRGASDDDVAKWLFGVARHVLSEFLRRGAAEGRALRRLGVEVPVLEPDDVARIVELAGLRQLRDAVADGLGELPPAHREAVQLRVVDELPYAAVAERLDVSESTARARVSRGLRALAAALDRTSITQESRP